MHELIVAGGGLSGVLVALAFHRRQPDLDLVLIEAGDRLGGNHTWSFHDSDLSPEQHAELTPFLSKRWPAQRVRFPGYERRLAIGYNSIESGLFHEQAMRTLASRVRLASPIAAVHHQGVELQTGEQLEGRCVIDARGASRSPHLHLGFQSFVGKLMQLSEPHGVHEPVIMDATVPQRDGYRFVYLLPFDQHRLLIEDTYYTRQSRLDVAGIGLRIDQYIAQSGWHACRLLRQEHGVLPLLLGGNFQGFWDEQREKAAPVGLRAALFHPTTGYSLPDAVKLADRLAVLVRPDTAQARVLIHEHALALWRRNRFFRILNRMLFLGATDRERVAVLARFYRLPQALIGRFFAGELRTGDKLRILCGRPPISLYRALACLPGTTGPGR